MRFSDLANELVIHVFQSCDSILDVLSLAATCHHFRSIFASQRIPILYAAAEVQYGPLTDAITLVTHTTSQPAHIPHPPPPLSFSLLTRLVQVGHIANQWAALFPFLKWQGEESSSRRFLTDIECFKLRRALYRLWLFTAAFHNPLHPRSMRRTPAGVQARCSLLRKWATPQLAEIQDLQGILRAAIASKICPSDANVRRYYRARFPNDYVHLSQTLELHTVGIARQRQRYSQHHFSLPPLRNGKVLSLGGWGDDFTHYYVVTDMLKLNPSELLFLYHSAHDSANSSLSSYSAATASYGTNKRLAAGLDLYDGTSLPPDDGVCGGAGVDKFVAELGEWFENNGETLSETIECVVEARGGDYATILDEVHEGLQGICIGTGWWGVMGE